MIRIRTEKVLSMPPKIQNPVWVGRVWELAVVWRWLRPEAWCECWEQLWILLSQQGQSDGKQRNDSLCSCCFLEQFLLPPSCILGERGGPLCVTWDWCYQVPSEGKTLDEEAQGRNVANFPLEVVFIDFNDLLGPIKARSVPKCRLKLWF